MEKWLREGRAGLSHSASVATPIDYMLKRWSGFARLAENGRVCLTSNTAERALRGLALGGRVWLADVLACIADTPRNRLDALLPWNWRCPAGKPAVTDGA